MALPHHPVQLAATLPVATAVPSWLAPTVIVSLCVGLFNIGWNFFTLWRTDRLRLLDQRKAAFAAQVGLPLETALSGFGTLLTELRILARQHDGGAALVAGERVSRCEALQTITFAPALANLQMALRRAGKFQEPAAKVDWFSFEDGFDPVMAGFDTLCRPTVDADRLRAAVQAMEGAVNEACDAIRNQLTTVATSLSTLRAAAKATATSQSSFQHPHGK